MFRIIVIICSIWMLNSQAHADISDFETAYVGGKFRQGQSPQIWRNRLIPVDMYDLTLTERRQVVKLMDMIQKPTCIRFITPVNITATTAYVKIVKTEAGSGCSSAMPNRPWYSGTGKQVFSMDVNECLYDQVQGLRHLMKILGAGYEHNRPMRRFFIDVLMENVKEDKKIEFEQYAPGQDPYSSCYPYDYESIMHFRDFEYTVNSEPTISPYIFSKKLGGDYLTQYDIAKLNNTYNCANFKGTELPDEYSIYSQLSD